MSRSTLAILAVLAAALLAGCGGEDETTPAATTLSTTDATTTTAEATTTDESEATVPPDDSAGTPEEADDPGSDRPRAIEDVVAAVLTGSEQAATICDDLVTPEYVKNSYGDREGCIAAQDPGSLAESVQISDVQESGDSATAVARPTGGPYDGVDVEVKLVPATDLDDAWLVDSLFADVPAGP